MPNICYFLIILTIGIVIRILPISSLPFDSDQAIVGLMGKHILEGSLPWLYYGDSYAGILEPLLASWSFLFMGPSRTALHLIPFFFSILFIISMYQLGRELFSPEIGLLSMLLAAVPPFSMGLYSALAYGGYIEILWLGNIVLLITHRLAIQKEPLAVLPLFFLGLLWGIAWWTHPISIVYLICSSCFLVYFKKEWVLKGKAFISAPGFILGGCPFWIWNIKQGFPFLTFSRSPENPDWFLKITPFPHQLLHFFNDGLKEPLSVSTFTLTSLFFGAILFLLIKKKWLQKKFLPNHGPQLLLIFFVTFCFIYIGSRFSEKNALRYLLPLYSIFPIVLILGCYALQTLNRTIFMVTLTVILGITASQQWSLITFFKRNSAQYLKQLQVEDTLFDFLKKKNYSYIYDPEYWSAAELTFNSQENPVFALPFQDRYPLYTLLADASSNPAFVLEGKHRKSFEEMFKAAGGTYKKEVFSPYQKIKGYVLYYDFTAPETPGLEIFPDLWTGKSNVNSGTEKWAFDRNITTGWTSSSPQQPGLFYQIDLGRVYKLNRLVLLSNKGKEWEFPAYYQIELSENSWNWKKISSVKNNWAYLFWSGSRPFWKLRDGRIENTFTPQKARFIKITLTASNPYPWTIGELFFYQATEPAKAKTIPAEEIITFLSRERIEYVYADIGLSAQITRLTRGKIKTPQEDYDITHGRDYSMWGYNDPFPYFNKFKKQVDFSLFPAFVVAKENQPSFQRTITTLNYACSVKVFGDQVIYYKIKASKPYRTINGQVGGKSFYWNGTHLLCR